MYKYPKCKKITEKIEKLEEQLQFGFTNTCEYFTMKEGDIKYIIKVYKKPTIH